MALRSKPHGIKNLHQVGGYAVGVGWSDGHDSIFPLDNLRRACPCNECGGDPERVLSAEAARLRALMRLGDASVFLCWQDGHETVYTLEQLRALCRCAYCVGEPENPLTGA